MSLRVTNLSGFGGGQLSENLNAAFIDSDTQTWSTQTSRTFSALSLGTPHPNRYILICFTMQGSASVTGVTLGGISATLVATGVDASATPDVTGGMWYIQDTSNTSADVVATFLESISGTATVSIIRVGGVTNINDDTYGAPNSATVNLTVATNGQAICVIGVNATSTTPSNCTEIADIATGADGHFVGYYTGASGSATFGCTATASNCYGVGLAFH